LDDNTVRLLELQGVCPVEKSGYFLIEPSRVKEMYVDIFGEVDLARYIHVFVPPTVWATGRSAIDVHLSGLFKAPELYGNIKLIDGNFEQWKTGTLLHHINADFDLNNDKILLHSLSAYDAQGGSVTAIGELDVTSALDYPFHVDIAVNRAAIMDIDDMQAVLSGALSFVGNTKGAVLKGELFTDRLDFTLNDDPSDIDHDLEVGYVNQNTQEAPPTQRAKPSNKWPVCYDLHIVNRESILIHSEEFTSEWKGDIKVTGCNTQPLLNGDFRILRGDFSLPDYLFPGKKFKISQGTISFAGDLNKKTTLYVVGEMEVEHIVAQVVVKGSLSNPSLAFRSNPPLSQREILSWILFGRGMGDITPFQGAELTQSFNHIKRSSSTAANKNSSFLTNLTRLKENLGIDRIGIDRSNSPDGKEEISLQVGKYILPDIFLGIKRNMSSDVNRIGLEANLRKNLKLQAEVGDDTDGQLHLKWKHDY
jgi:translocation and assembly module TamB